MIHKILELFNTLNVISPNWIEMIVITTTLFN